MPEERKTIQKEAVESYLSTTFCHPSAQKVYLNVKKELPNISKATVYRILRNFKKKGKIQELPGEVSRWDYKEKPHPHFVCVGCNAIIDIADEFEMPSADELDVGEVRNCKIIFSGYCKECNKKVEN